jgi:pilus assembly protein CpaC
MIPSPTRFPPNLLLLATILSVSKLPAQSVPSTTQPGAIAPQHLALDQTPPQDTLHVTVGRSLILHVQTRIRRILVGNPAVLQSLTTGPQELVVTAKAAGISSLVLWDEQGRSCVYTVSSDIDPTGLREALKQAYPASLIAVQAIEDRLSLSGIVPTQDVSDGAAKLAAIYSKEVANSLQVIALHNKQVELKLRIVEVDRTKLDQFAVNFTQGGRTAATTSTLQFSNPLNLTVFNAKLNLGLQIQDLQQKQVLQVLAEPTLTTLSGQVARFLSGGEFPFPVVQSSGGTTVPVVTIQFRSYGVKVEFTPTVNPDGTIRLKVAPEVSALDYTNAVTISGFTIPALSTRRADTEVELKDGQTFMLSGLLDHRTTENLANVPGIGSVPILGQLFRSKNNNHSVVELVVIVTVNTVNPLTDPKPEIPALPKPAVPDLNPDAFDRMLHPAGQPGPQP